MGLLHAIIGNAGEINASDAQQELGAVLGEGENVELAYKLIRDQIILTNRRLIFIDKQGVTGEKVEYRSIPYKSVTNFSIETAGHLDLDAEMKIWISGIAEPIKKQFSKGANIYKLQAHLAQKIAG
ncbi:PH domain-containing protein [Escherichia coli]|uniref:PH domain-containing protein n=1 Tax=Escherichia coli TaxID=562 RepID=UPI0022B725C4|nr:PH domain-containing protein [Escherichia coli]MCZ7349684.1 PH domain-containing protein [Escherichia coli]HCT4557131.1 PH domain-containing protein [Escherichia coli]